MTDEFLISELYNHCVFMKNIPHGLGEIFKKSKKKLVTQGQYYISSPGRGLKSIINFLKLAEENDKICISASHIWLFGITSIFLKLRKKI